MIQVITNLPSWADNRSGDAATLATEANTPAVIRPLPLVAFFQLAVLAGADPAELGKMWPASALVDRAEMALKNGDLAGISAIIATLPGLGIAPATLTALGAVVAERRVSAGALNWNDEDGECPETFTAEWVTADLTAKGYTWNGTAWVRS